MQKNMDAITVPLAADDRDHARVHVSFELDLPIHDRGVGGAAAVEIVNEAFRAMGNTYSGENMTFRNLTVAEVQ